MVRLLIKCPVLHAIPFPPKGRAFACFKVKIERLHLWKALTNESKDVRIRLGRTRSRWTLSPTTTQSTSEGASVSLAFCNCRGMFHSEPYLNALVKSVDIILIQEHWLWPYELCKLSSYLPRFKSVGKSDRRLTDLADFRRGCGGVGILWRESLNVDISRKTTQNHRIICIDIPLSE